MHVYNLYIQVRQHDMYTSNRLCRGSRDKFFQASVFPPPHLIITRNAHGAEEGEGLGSGNEAKKTKLPPRRVGAASTRPARPRSRVATPSATPQRFQDFTKISRNFTKDFKISAKISGFHEDFKEDFKISVEISAVVYEISASGGPLAKISSSFIRMTSKATDLPSGPLDSPVSDIHIAKIAQDFIRNWEKLAPYLQLLPAHEDVIKKNGRYGHQKREALRMWKEQNGNKATYRALIVIAKQVSNVELAENIEALVAPHPPHRENGPSRAVDLKMIQHYEGSARAPAAHAPGHCKHNEGVFE